MSIYETYFRYTFNQILIKFDIITLLHYFEI